VTTSVVVRAPAERAFETFTRGIASWWNADHHLLEGELADMIFEPWVGGNIYDLGVDGSECRWSRVLAYEPPTRVVFSWDIDLDWKVETDPSRASEVEVRFVGRGPDATLVELEHRHLDRHGEGWGAMQAAVGSPNGWGSGLELFAAALA
jgi:uncharacterized protein YndB with AHSA1/START domain